MNTSDRPLSLYRKAKNLSEAAVQVAKHLKNTGEMLVEPKEYSDRVAICAGCSMYEKTEPDTCHGCGCPVKARKAWLIAVCCPLQYWEGDIDKLSVGICKDQQTTED